jgi:hypothetical protein
MGARRCGCAGADGGTDATGKGSPAPTVTETVTAGAKGGGDGKGDSKQVYFTDSGFGADCSAPVK